MADFAAWIVAAESDESALPWQPGAFLAAYTTNQDTANDLTLEASPVAQAVRDLKPNRGAAWLGSATELLADLEATTPEAIRRQQSWPKDGRRLRGILDRLAPNLRAAGVGVTFGRTGRKRLIKIEQGSDAASSASSASLSAPVQGMLGDVGALDDAALRHPDHPASPPASLASAPEPAEWREESASGDAGDAGDAEIHDRSDRDDDPWELA
jgi:hypothetical protein